MKVLRTLFRLCLKSHPRAVRQTFEEEATEAFLMGLRRRRSLGALPALRYAVATLLDALITGVSARWRSARLAFRWGEGAGGKLRYAVRRLLRAPVFTLSVVGMLALGVGANGAVSSALRVGVLAEPPFSEPDRLVYASIVIEGEADSQSSLWSYPMYQELREASGAIFERISGYAIRYISWSEPGPAESVPVEFIAGDYFALLRVRPAAGRFFAPEEESPSAPPAVAVLSHAMWMERFGGDHAAVGASIVLDGSRVRIVGVAPAGFRGLSGRAAVWLPIGQARSSMGNWTTEARHTRWFHAVARLRADLTVEQARLRFEPIARAIEEVAPRGASETPAGAALMTLTEVWTNPVTKRSLWLVTAGSALVLLVGIANIAGLLIARGRRDARDRAVRMALGASRLSLLRQSVLEGLILAAAGGAAGLLIAHAALAAMRTLWPARLLQGAAGDVQSIDPANVAFDLTAMMVSLGLAIAAAMAASITAVLVSGSLDLAPALQRSSGGRGSGSRTDARSRSWLVGAQAALSVVLVITAGLLSITLLRMHDEQRGFNADRLLVLSYSLVGRPAMRSHESRLAFHTMLRDRVAQLGGVRDVALGSSPPLAGGFMLSDVRGVVGRPPLPEEQRLGIGVHVADSRLFHLLEVRLLRGRSFTLTEERNAGRLVVLSRSAAEALFASDDPVGRQIEMRASQGDPVEAWTVIGIVDDLLYRPVAEGTRPEAYIPLGLWSPPGHTLFVRTAGDPAGLVPAIRDVLATVDPAVPFSRIQTGHQLRTQGIADTRALTFLLLAFAALALLLSAAGVWAVVAEAVAERHREIGIRVALGADGGAVERLILMQGLAPVLTGVVLGMGLAAAVGRQLDDFLFRTTPHDARIYVAAALVVFTLAALSSWLPARRAARVCPTEALGGD